jgi:hypothetical protein
MNDPRMEDGGVVDVGILIGQNQWVFVSENGPVLCGNIEQTNSA